MSDTIEPFGSLKLEITRGQHWIEDGTGIRYEVVESPAEVREIRLRATQTRHESKTVSLDELLACFTQSLSGTLS